MIEVWHRVDRVAAMTMGFSGKHKTFSFPEDFVKVAEVKADDVEDAFRLTNNIDCDWRENEEVTVLVPGCPYILPEEINTKGRGLSSTSVGDIIVENKVLFLCVGLGWKRVFEGVGYENINRWRPDPGPPDSVRRKIENKNLYIWAFVCSDHVDYKEGCPQCDSGSWVDWEEYLRDEELYRRDPDAWRAKNG